MTEFASRRRLLAGAAALIAAPLAARAQPAAAPTPSAAAPAAPEPAAASGAPSAVIDVNRARAAPIPIAIPDLGGSPLGAQIAGVITSDLANSGLFRPISPQGFIGANDAGAAGGTPNFDNWKAIGAQALVTGSVAGSGGSVRVEFRLWDVLPQQQIQGTAYTTTEANWRRIAHIIADVIYQRLLGEKGYFDTRIAYVANTGPYSRVTKRLAVMDQDGANNRFLTNGQWMVLTPRFSPVRDEIAFMSFANDRPRVYLFDLGSGSQRVLGDFPGMTFSPRFSPDGGSVIMALAAHGGSDIVEIGISGGGVRRLTSSGSIDVSPCFSPDGAQIVFNSDRGGDQQLYVMDAGGGGVRRISFGNGRYATPVWSPRGDLIAFTRLGSTDSGNFSIGVMAPDGSGERLIAEGYDVEGPTFCPNGRVLMFWKSEAGSLGQLVSIDVTGFNQRTVPTATAATDPAWSPLNG